MRWMVVVAMLAACGSAEAQTVIDGTSKNIPKHKLRSGLERLKFELDGFRNIRVRNLIRTSQRDFYCGYYSAEDENGRQSPFQKFLFLDDVVALPSPFGAKTDDAYKFMVAQYC